MPPSDPPGHPARPDNPSTNQHQPHTLGSSLEGLYAMAVERRTGDPTTSYTARLVADPLLAAKKLGEEGVETALAAATGNRAALREESADLLFHLCALWASCDITPSEVAEVLRARQGVSGLVEKAARGHSDNG